MNSREKIYIEDIMKEMEKIQYGWIDINNKIHINTIKELPQMYRLANIDEMLEYKVGICFDQVELERFYFEKIFETYSYAIISTHMVHTFLILKNDNNDYIYFEHSSAKSKGIYYFKDKEMLLESALNQFMIRHNIKTMSNIKIVPYSKLPNKITFKKKKKILLDNNPVPLSAV